MSDHEPHPAPTGSPKPEHGGEHAARDRRGAALVAGVLVVGGCVLGALGGWLWYLWWGPPGEGSVYRTDQGPRWFPDPPFEAGLARDFTATAQYALVGAGSALLLGLVAGWLGRRQAYAALAGVLVGTGLAAWLAFVVGTAMSPDAPADVVARGDAEVGDGLSDGIDVTGWTPYLSWPIGGLCGFVVTVLGGAAVGEVRRRESQPETWLERRTGG